MTIRRILPLAWVRHCLLGIIVPVLVTGPAAFAQQPAGGLLSPALENTIRALMDEGDIPGMSVVVVGPDREVLSCYGYADLATKAPVTPRTLFELGSCSKAFTALAVATLEQQGKLRLDDAVTAYLPWFRVIYQDRPAPVTVRHLLNHTSGIPWNTLAGIPQTRGPQALRQTVEGLKGQVLSNAPGKSFEYATINYDVLALIIQQVAGRPFEDYVQENVLDRLGLAATAVGRAVDPAAMATGYKIGFFEPRPYAAPVFGGNNAAGYVISNAGDVARWLKFQLGLGAPELYPLAVSTHQRDESVPVHNQSFYARGWNVMLNGTGEINHAGMNPNFTAYVAFRPGTRTGVAVLANSNSAYTALIGDRIMRELAGEEVEKKVAPPDGNDKIYSILSGALAAYVLTVLFFMVLVAADVKKGRRTYAPLTARQLGKFGVSLAAGLPFLYGLYLLPKALAGFTWQATLVWSPVSFAALVGLLLAAMGGTYAAQLAGMCFPARNKFKNLLPRVTLVGVLSGLANAAIIILVTAALNADAEAGYLLFYYALALCVYLLGRRFVQVSIIRYTRELVCEMRISLVEKMFATSYQQFEKIDRGRVYTALNDDVNTIGDSTSVVVMMITSLITVVGAFAYLAFIAFWATLVTVLLILSIAGIYYIAASSNNAYLEQARDASNGFMTLLNGMIDGFKEISLRQNRKRAYREDISASASEYRNKLTTSDIRFVNAFLFVESLLIVLLGVVSFAIPRLFPDIAFYTLMSFVVIVLYSIGPINGTLGSIPSLMRLKVAWSRVNQFLEEIPPGAGLPLPPPVVPSRVSSFRAQGLRFHYKDGNEKHAFGVGPIDLEAKSGEILFIIGGNGSGKTTLAKLITGLYEPQAGELFIDGQPVRGAQLGEFFSAVFNPVYLFEKLYDIDADGQPEEVRQYLSLLQLEQKVRIAGNRYSTIDLSAGQRKRLALLQCYLEKSPIFLLDEWGADQDPEYRKFFYRTLLPRMRDMGKIVIAITHDDHYFDVADQVLKMNEGKLEAYRMPVPALP